MPIPEPMLSTRAATWPAHGDWRMEPKWDGFRLLVAIDNHGCVRAWSRRGTTVGDRLGSLLEPLVEAPRRSVFDGELVALSSQDGRAVQDFAVVCRATLQGGAAAAGKPHLVAFDLLELAGEDLRALPWVKRKQLLREAFPAGDRLRLVQARPASRAAHDQLVSLGFEGSVLKRPGSTYRPGRQTAWRKYKASHRRRHAARRPART
jgi:ATP-dependent DNA ligase